MTAYTLKSAFLSGLVAATSLMASTALAQEYQWTFQTSAQAGDNFFPIEEAWADRVKELSDGRIEITVVPVGTV
ncbi:MAG: C4-dicarboxylate ABC transporter substrate-binding protein, partial [Marinovum algicola]